ncbi:MAG: hypothetical protein ACLRIO_04060 [Butyricicoccus sp.]
MSAMPMPGSGRCAVEPVAPGDLLVLPVHGQQPVGDRRGHALGAEQ